MFVCDCAREWLVLKREKKKMKVWRWLLSLFVGLLLPVSIMGRFVVEKNSLRVASPEKIRGTHDSAIGNFGIPQYGGSMAGNVVYPKDNKKGCKEFDESGISFKSSPGALPTIVLLDRGSKFLFLLLPYLIHLLLLLHKQFLIEL